MMTQTVLTAVFLFSQSNGLDPYVVAGLIQKESSFNEKAVGNIGEIGLMQLRPEFHEPKELEPVQKLPFYLKGVEFFEVMYPTQNSLFDPETNIAIGTRYLRKLSKSCVHKDDYTFVVCFNRGPTNARKVTDPYSDEYYNIVMTNAENFRKQNVFGSYHKGGTLASN